MKTGQSRVWTRTAAIVSIAVFDRETISPQMMFVWWTPPMPMPPPRADRERIDGCNYGRSLLSRLITLLPPLSSPSELHSLSKTFSLPPSTLVDPFQARAVEGGKEAAAEEIDSSRVVETKMAKIAGNSGCDDDSFSVCVSLLACNVQ